MIDVAEHVRRSGAYRWFRFLQLLICGAIALIGVMIAVARPAAWPAAAVAGAIAGVVWTLFAWRLRAVIRGSEQASATLAEVARADLDAPAEVILRDWPDGLDALASSPSFARMIGRRSVRFAAQGTWKGNAVELGTALVAARDLNMLVSHVRVPGASEVGLFRIMSRGLATRMSRWHRPQHPVTLGDDAFDAAWVVDADEAVARRVLDAELRSELMRLHAQIPSMGTASVEVMPGGLYLRWPGALNEGWAARLRDLALRVDERLRAR